MSKAFFIAAILAYAALATAVGDGLGKEEESHICFKNKEKGLDWPIGNPRDIAGAIFHGSHCVDSALDYIANKDHRTLQYLHVSHCRTIVEMCLKFFQENPDYKIPSMVCDDLVDLATDESCDRSSGRPRCKRWGRPLILLNVMWGSKPTKRYYPAEPTVASKADAHAIYPDFAKDVRDQRELLTRITNENVDKVFTKHWKNENVTEAESEYVAKWHQPAIHRLSALGLYCREGKGSAPIETLKRVLQAMPEDEFAEVL